MGSLEFLYLNLDRTHHAPELHKAPSKATMARHSKNNTSNSVFSYAEYKKLDYGTKKQRLGVDSMKDRLSCALCLQRARDPVACSEGHLYCKECIYTDLLEQKKEIKRQQVKLEAMAKEEEEEKERRKVAARERVLKDFEERQLGLGTKKTIGDRVAAEKEDKKGKGVEGSSPDACERSVSLSS